MQGQYLANSILSAAEAHDKEWKQLHWRSENKKIKTEINTRNNKKHYDSLKLKRETLINKFSNLK